MKNIKFKDFWPHLLALVIFASISSIYFYPVLQGYKLKQSDIKQHKGMAHEIRSHQEDLNEEPLWTGSMFGGMPAYQISATHYSGNIIDYIHEVLQLGFAHPINILILYMVGFYIFLLCLRINPWLSIIGAVIFAFSSYFIIIIDVGHNTKALAIAYMPAVLGGIISILRGRVWLGLLITAVFMGLELRANHFQITYYLIFAVLAVGIVEMIYQIKAGEAATFFKRAGLVLVAVIIGVLPNLGNLLTTYEYSKASTRSPSELTITPSGETNEHNKSSGLDKDYITRWSNGIEESFSLMIPNIKGEKSGAILADEEEIKRLRREDPQFFNFLVSQYQNEEFIVNTYWGNQPFTSGAVYAGIIVCFLAFLALFFVKDRLVVGLGVAALLALLLSWGKNFMGFTEFFIDYVPLYDKFRAVSMTLVVVEMVLPALAILFLYKLYNNKAEILEQKKRFLMLCAVFGGVLLLFWVTPDTFFDFLSKDEVQHMNAQLQKNGQQANNVYAGFESLKDYRIDIFQADVVRGLQFLALAFALMLLYLYKKLNRNLLIVGVGLLAFVDLWSIDKHYINNKEKAGASARSSNRYIAYQSVDQNKMPYKASPVDKAILQREIQKNPALADKIEQKLAEKRREETLSNSDIESVQYTQLMRETHYRVLNTIQKMDEDAQTAYFHKTLGGYHAAKLKKYQELIDFKLGYEHFQLRQAFLQGGKAAVRQLLPKMNVTNMLNAKYIIGAENSANGQRLSYVQNNYALGNAWFVNDYKVVPDADKEILAVKELQAGETAVIRAEDEARLSQESYQKNSGDFIRLKSYLPNKLVYEYQAASKQFAVFSEIYYDKGWTAYIDGKEVPYFKVDYILRGMELPKGSGEIVFIFDPMSYEIGRVATWVSSILILLLGGFVVFRKLKKREENEKPEEVS